MKQKSLLNIIIKNSIISIVTFTTISSFFVIPYFNNSNHSNIISNNNSNILDSTKDAEPIKTILEQKTPNLSGIWAGSISHWIKENNTPFNITNIFNFFINVVNPATNDPTSTEKEVNGIKYNDSTGVIDITARIKPYILNGVVIQDFSSSVNFSFSGFEKYTEPTELTLIKNGNNNILASEINEITINNYIQVINQPKLYESPGKIKYTYIANNTKSELTVFANLTKYIAPDPENPGSFKLFEAIDFKTPSITITNFKNQLATIFPTKDILISGSSLDKIASTVSKSDIQELLSKKLDHLPPSFNPLDNIKIDITSVNNVLKKVVFNAEINNYYNELGILVTNPKEPYQLKGYEILELKEPMSSALEVNISNVDSKMLAQTASQLENESIIKNYITITNPVGIPTPTNAIIRDKNFNNATGKLEITVVMKPYLFEGEIKHEFSPQTILNVTGFLQVTESIIEQNTSMNILETLPSQVDFNDKTSPLFISNYLKFNSFPENTEFNYTKIENGVNDNQGSLAFIVTPNKRYNSECVYQEKTSGLQFDINIKLSGFKEQKPSKVTIKENYNTNYLPSDLLLDDEITNKIITDQFLNIENIPDGFNIVNRKAQNILGTFSFSISIDKYYDQNGIFVDSAIANKHKLIFNFQLSNLEKRTLSILGIKNNDLTNILPSSIDDKNWIEYIDVSTFPKNTTFESKIFRPYNISGDLEFSTIPTSYYDNKGLVVTQDVNNSSSKRFQLLLNKMQKNDPTSVTPASDLSLEEWNKLPTDVSELPNEQIKKYIKIINPFNNAMPDEFDIVTKKPNNITGALDLELSFNNFFDFQGNPQSISAEPAPYSNYNQLILIKPLKKYLKLNFTNTVIPTVIIEKNNGEINLSEIDPSTVNPENINQYIQFNREEQNGKKAEIVQGSIRMISTPNELESGLISFECKIINYYDINGNFISNESDTIQTTIYNFKNKYSNQASSSTFSIFTIVIIIFFVLIILMLIIALILRYKKYYINESYDRGLITTEDSSIPLVIKEHKRILKNKIRLIPLLTEEKPSKPLKEYKEVKVKEVKVKEPKKPILPGQRKREFLLLVKAKKEEMKSDIKKQFSTNDFPINEPFEIGDKWYYCNDKKEYFISDNDEWVAADKPKKPKKPKKDKN